MLHDDIDAAVREIAHLCQTWGGASQPLLPVREGHVDPPYMRLLETEQVDFVGGLGDIAVTLPWRVEDERPWDHPVLAIAAQEPRDRWRTVEVVDLAADDPWRIVYAAVLGVWPEAPTATLLEHAFLRPDLRFEEVIPVERRSVSGSLTDLIQRLSARSLLTPRTMSNIFLASGLEPDASLLGHGRKVLPNRHATRRAAGPNLIVAMTAGSVADLALLWNLRAAHGDGRVLPIGLPVEEVTAQALALLQQPGNATMFGLGGGKIHVTSASVSVEELERFVHDSRTAVAVGYEEILTLGPAAGRDNTQVAVWRDGTTRLTPMTETDRDLLTKGGGIRQPQMVIDVEVVNFPIPADGTMRGHRFFRRFQAGAAQVAVSSLDRHGTVGVSWPSTWTCLGAVAHSHGLVVAESEAGVAAATLIRALGGITEIGMLRHRALVALLYEMAERSGMAWWKKRWTRTERLLRTGGASDKAIEELARQLGRDDPAVAPPGEGRALPFQKFVAALGGSRPAAEHWIAWAERRHLVVRGADVACAECRTKSWLPMGSLPPPVVCPGCGRVIDQPYGPRDLQFTYRIGEPLRRVLETDSLGHVFALRWLVQLFGRPALVGAHPGVTFHDARTRRDIGEADVILLFNDGTLVPVEVKRRVAGADDRSETLMNTLRDAIHAPFDVLAVTEPARDCPDLATRERRLPAAPRLVITDDQLHQGHVFWQAGADPFAWAPLTSEEDAARDRKFTEWLAKTDPDAPWDDVGETLLNPALHARPDRTSPSADA